MIAKTVFTLYPRRTVLCFSLFVGQAFLYNAFFFTYGDTLTTFLGVEQTGWYIAVFAVSNFLGALLLSRLFDTVGRVQDDRRHLHPLRRAAGDRRAGARLATAITLTLFGAVIFFFASAGRQRGVPDGQRDLPDGDPRPVHRLLLRHRHGGGGIAGPLLFGALIENASGSEDITKIALGYFIGAALMIIGGVVEIFLGVKAEGQSLESIAQAAHRRGRRR